MDECHRCRGRSGHEVLPFDGEFQSLAALSNEGTNILGSGDPGTLGTNIDTNSRRMISGSFLEDCCGVEWQWIQDQLYQYDASSWSFKATIGSKGQLYSQGTYGDVKLVAGGSWSDGGIAGRGAGLRVALGGLRIRLSAFGWLCEIRNSERNRS